MIITVKTFLCARFHSTASQLFCARRPLLRYPQVTHGKRVTTFRSVSDKLSVFTATAQHSLVLSQANSSPTTAWQPQKWQAVHTPMPARFLGVRSLITQMTKPGNVELTYKNFWWVSQLDHEKLKPKFTTQKLPDRLL